MTRSRQAVIVYAAATLQGFAFTLVPALATVFSTLPYNINAGAFGGLFVALTLGAIAATIVTPFIARHHGMAGVLRASRAPTKTGVRAVPSPVRTFAMVMDRVALTESADASSFTAEKLSPNPRPKDCGCCGRQFSWRRSRACCCSRHVGPRFMIQPAAAQSARRCRAGSSCSALPRSSMHFAKAHFQVEQQHLRKSTDDSR